MFDLKSYRNKNKLLIIGSILFVILAYFLSFSKTLDLYIQNKGLEKKAILSQNAPEKIRNLKKQLGIYEAKMQKFGQDSLSKDEYRLNILTQLCKENNVVMVSLPESFFQKEATESIETQEIKLRGNFIDLLKLIYTIEYKTSLGMLASVKFVTEEDRRMRVQYLYAYLYIQNLKNRKNEN
ncbi:hypothetical protein AD998_21195 [bacterium 336/3]|nr:hypothetical protein AD998_21195 [bacterium 336/3]